MEKELKHIQRLYDRLEEEEDVNEKKLTEEEHLRLYFYCCCERCMSNRENMKAFECFKCLYPISDNDEGCIQNNLNNAISIDIYNKSRDLWEEENE